MNIYLIALSVFIIAAINKFFSYIGKNEGAQKRQIHTINFSKDIPLQNSGAKTHFKNTQMQIKTELERIVERPVISEKNKWLYPTSSFGKMEKGVVD